MNRVKPVFLSPQANYHALTIFDEKNFPEKIKEFNELTTKISNLFSEGDKKINKEMNLEQVKEGLNLHIEALNLLKEMCDLKNNLQIVVSEEEREKSLKLTHDSIISVLKASFKKKNLEENDYSWVYYSKFKWRRHLPSKEKFQELLEGENEDFKAFVLENYPK